MKTTVQHKNWDSQFFGFRVGDLFVLSDETYLSKQLQEYKKEGYRLIYWKIEDNDLVNKKTAESLGLFLGDTKYTYRYKISASTVISESSIQVKEYDGPISETLIDLGLQSGIYSRFKLDPNFEPGTFEKMYTKWIENSFSGDMADAIFIVEENKEMIGFTTVFYNQADLEIVLIAIAENYRKIGYGKKMIEYIKAFAIKNRYENIYVITQQQNKPACALYESCGFELIKIEYIYHIWL